jgi:hypothetical protein
MVKLNESERLRALDELEEKFKSVIEKKQQELERERVLLETVLESQGVGQALLRSTNLDATKAIAAVNLLLG